MKCWSVLVAIASALVLPSAATAQDKPAKLLVTIDGSLGARLTLVDGRDTDRCVPAKDHLERTTFDGQRDLWDLVAYRFPVDKAKEKGPRIPLSYLDGRKASDPVVVLRSALSSGTKWVCRKGTESTVHEATIEKVSLDSGVVAISSPDPTFAPSFEWRAFGAPFGAAIRDALGTPTACEYRAAGAAQAEPKSCTHHLTQDEVTFGITPAEAKSGTIHLSFGAKKLAIGVKSCTYRYEGPLPIIVQGARRQIARISSSEPACLSRLRGSGASNGEKKIIRFSANGVSLPGLLEANGDAGAVSVALGGISGSMKTGTYEWEIASGKDVYGSVQLDVGDPVSLVSKKLAVHYGNSELDAAQSGESADDIAVVDLRGKPQEQRKVAADAVAANGTGTSGSATPATEPSRVINTASLKLPDGLIGFAESMAVAETEDGLVSASTDRSCRCDSAPGWLWTARSLAENVSPEGEDMKVDGVTDRSVLLPRATQLGFHVTARSSQPLSFLLTLHGARRCEAKNVPTTAGTDTCVGATGSVISLDAPILEVAVQVASSAREESVPLPIASAVEVVCHAKGHWVVDAENPLENSPDRDMDRARNGELHAVEERAFETGQCWAVFDYEKILNGPDLAQYGPQALQVTVHRDAATDATVVWPLRPAARPPSQSRETCTSERRATLRSKKFPTDYAECSCAYPDRTLWCGRTFNDALWMPLPGPTGDPSAEAPYVVTIRVAARPTAFAVYRGGSDSTLAKDDRLTAPELQFSARLHSRGTFGWQKFDIRTFFTVPIDLSGFRFPAAASDLTSTKQSEVVQLIQPRVGLRFGVDPWDYDKSAHPWPVQLRFLTGFHLFQLADPGVAVSYALGVSATLPIFDKAPSQLGTSVAIGAFWEVDLREVGGDFKFDRANHFVLTAGFNVLSLLGAK